MSALMSFEDPADAEIEDESSFGFDPQDVIVLEELDQDERERFIEFLIEEDVQFFKDTDGTYTANIRIVEEVEHDSVDVERQLSPSVAARPRPATASRRASRPPGEMARVVGAISAAASLFDYSCYPKLSSLVTLRDQLTPRRRSLAWLMRMIEEIYDERFKHDTLDLREQAMGSRSRKDASERLSNIFPVFVVDYFSKRFGLRKIVDQTCWDMIYNVHALRKNLLEVEIFARFLEEYYDSDDLLFFLYVRSVAEKELALSFRQRWSELGRGKDRSPKPVLLSLRETGNVARIVFGSDAREMQQDFMSRVRHFITTSPSASRNGSPRASKTSRGVRSGRSDAQGLIEVHSLLHIALNQYHDARPTAPENASGNAASQVSPRTRGQELQFREAEAEYDLRMSQPVLLSSSYCIANEVLALSEGIHSNLISLSEN